jgi:2-amino-4-hydroxy-6-hydroxymethyldihydropteridine diphosphokinase
MNTAYLLTGGNMGAREENLLLARERIREECGEIIAVSSLYETAAWGKTDQPSFLNQVLQIETKLKPRQLLLKILEIEEQVGRKRKEKYGPRIIDIDILFFNNQVYKSSLLTIPHPEIQNRRFVLVPMAEIAPDFVHPVLKETIIGLLAVSPDQLEVKRMNIVK